MKINGNTIRTGNIIEHQGRLWRATKVHIVQMGNWRSFLQVELRDSEPILRGREPIEPLGSRAVGQENAIALLRSPPHPPSQLMQLR